MKSMSNVLESQSSEQTVSISSLTSPVLNEAEELRRQQLAIEREVSTLKLYSVNVIKNKDKKLPNNITVYAI